MTGRIRTLKPEWLDDEKLSALSREARILSVALILLADDHGNGRSHPLFLAARVFPYGDARESLASVERGLDELSSIGFVQTYNVQGQQYFHIRNWSKHQRVDKVGKPRVPRPEDPGAEMSSRGPREVLAPDLRPPTSDLRPPTSEHTTSRAHAPARGDHPGEDQAQPFDDLLSDPPPGAPPKQSDPATAGHVELAYESGWQQHRAGEAIRITARSRERFREAALLVNDQARIDGKPPQLILRDVMAAFWASTRIGSELQHAPGAIASQFAELYASTRAKSTNGKGAPTTSPATPTPDGVLVAEQRDLNRELGELVSQPGKEARVAEIRTRIRAIGDERRRLARGGSTP